MSNDDFKREYDRRVDIEATYVFNTLVRTADELDYMKDIFIEDVIKKLHTLKKEVEE